MASKRKLKILTIDQKMQLFAEVDKKTVKRKDIAAKYGIPQNSLSTIIKNRAKVEDAFATSNFQPNRKRQRHSLNETIDRSLFLWFKQQREVDAPISGSILTKQAHEIAQEEECTDFVASPGWIYRFKQRHGIDSSYTLSGEAGTADTPCCSNEPTSVLSKYEPNNIFYAGETGLLYKCLPNTSLALKREKCTGGSQAKERLSVLLATNKSGTEKLPLLVIGRKSNPRCFQNVHNRPVEYLANKKAWMTATIFEEWVRKLDQKFRMQGRSVAMIVDNCPAHPELDGLKAIKLVLFPRNTTSHLRPCAQGISNSFKHHYRTRVVKKYLAHIKETAALSALPSVSTTFNVSIVETLADMQAAWDKLTEETIRNCFRHADSYAQSEETVPEAEVSISQSAAQATEVETLADDELHNLFQRLGQNLGIDPVLVSVSDYVTFDNELETSATCSNPEAAAYVTTDDTEERGSDEDGCTSEANPIRSLKEAKSAFKILQGFAQQHPLGHQLFDCLGVLQDILLDISTAPQKQTVMTDFFGK